MNRRSVLKVLGILPVSPGILERMPLELDGARFWIGGISDSFDNSRNWAYTSGGTSGVPPPTKNSNVIFDEGGCNPCVVTEDLRLGSLKITAGYNSLITLKAILTIGVLHYDSPHDTLYADELWVACEKGC